MNNDILLSPIKVSELTNLIQTSVETAIRSANTQRPVESDITSIQGAADITNRTVGSLYQLTHKGEIPHFKRGNKLYFSKKALEAWITGQ